MKLTPTLLSCCVFPAIIVVLLLANATSAVGQGGADIYEFAGGLDGQLPVGPVVFDSSGSLYGVTEEGGVYSHGTVYKLNPPSQPGGSWTKDTIYAFTDGTDGGDPFTTLVLDKAGSLYGVTGLGGDLTKCDGNGCGTIFQLTQPAVAGGQWTETTIYAFRNELGRTGLTVDAAGALYGAATSYTTNNTYIFKLSPPLAMGSSWTRTIISGVNYNIEPNMVFDNKGALYGAVWSAIFKLSPPTSRGGRWSLVYIYDFTYNADPYAGPVIDERTGHLFGTAPYGGLKRCPGTCGVAWELAESGGVWHEENIYDFTGRADGFFPMAAVTFDTAGALYTTSSYGSQFGPGSVIRLTPMTQTGAWTEETLWQVTGGTGSVSSIVVHDGSLFGTAESGGSGLGAVFQVEP